MNSKCRWPGAYKEEHLSSIFHVDFEESNAPISYLRVVGGWTNPSENSGPIGSFPQVGVKQKNIFETTT